MSTFILQGDQAVDTSQIDVKMEEVEQENKPTELSQSFYLRYYAGHTAQFGKEFMEFSIQSNGKLRYANDSKYRGSSSIRKQVVVTDSIIQLIKQLVEESNILQADDNDWPPPDKSGRQELEIVYQGQHISFITYKITSISELTQAGAPQSLIDFYYLTQDLKRLFLTLIKVHFRLQAF